MSALVDEFDTDLISSNIRPYNIDHFFWKWFDNNKFKWNVYLYTTDSIFDYIHKFGFALTKEQAIKDRDDFVREFLLTYKKTNVIDDISEQVLKRLTDGKS